jgi:hypothetical protein
VIPFCDCTSLYLSDIVKKARWNNEYLSEFEDIDGIIFEITGNTSSLADELDLRNVLNAALVV